MDGSRRCAARGEGTTPRLRASHSLGDGLRFGCLPPFIRRKRVPSNKSGSLARHRRDVCAEDVPRFAAAKRLTGTSLSPVAIKFNKAKGRWHLCQRPFGLFTDFRRSDLRRHFPPILADIAEDKNRPPLLLFQIP